MLYNTIMKVRPIEPEDLEVLYEIENEPGTWAVATPGGPYSHFALTRYIEQLGTDIFASGQMRLMVLDDDGISIGTLDITNYSPTDRSAEIGIAVRSEYRGKGWGMRMIQWLEQYAIKELNLRMLYARVADVQNLASQRLFSSLGYEKVAVLPEWVFLEGEYVDIAVFRKMLR